MRIVHTIDLTPTVIASKRDSRASVVIEDAYGELFEVEGDPKYIVQAFAKAIELIEAMQ